MHKTIPVAPRTIVNPLIRDTVTFLELSAETQGAYSHIRIELAPGGGNARHVHQRFDEMFRCMRGTLGVQVGGTSTLLEPGQAATVTAGQPHRFFNPSKSEPVTFDVTITPGSVGFGLMLQVAYGLAADGLTNSQGIPKNLYHTALLVHWGDTNMPGVLSLLDPVLRRLAARAIRNGTAQSLINRYRQF